MMSVTEKLAYIKGLCEGLELKAEKKEGRVLLAIVDLLDDLTQEVSAHENDIEQIFHELDAIDEDLTDVEDALLYDDEDDWDDEDWYDDEYWDDLEDEDEEGCGCGHHHHDGECGCGHDHENPIYEITCPKCGDVVCVDEETLFSSNCACPNCDTKFEITDEDEDKEMQEGECSLEDTQE